MGYARGRAIGEYVHPFGGKPLQHHGGEFGIVLTEGQPRLDDGDGGSQPAVRLRHFQPDGTRPQHQEVRGQRVVRETASRW
jgi:hypothetical protein